MPKPKKILKTPFYKGIEWFACWLLDNVEGKTVAEETLRDWAVQAWQARNKKKRLAYQQMVRARKKVRAQYPNAYAYNWAGKEGWTIYSDKPIGNRISGAINVADSSERRAWISAAKRLRHTPR